MLGLQKHHALSMGSVQGIAGNKPKNEPELRIGLANIFSDLYITCDRV
jgi:hypothetical protein